VTDSGEEYAENVLSADELLGFAQTPPSYGEDTNNDGEVGNDDGSNNVKHTEEKKTKRVEEFKNQSADNAKLLISFAKMLPNTVAALNKEPTNSMPPDLEEVLMEGMRPYLARIGGIGEVIPDKTAFWICMTVIILWNLTETGLVLNRVHKKRKKATKTKKESNKRIKSSASRGANESFQIDKQGRYRRLRKQDRKSYSFTGGYIPDESLKGKLLETMALTDLPWVLRDNWSQKKNQPHERVYEALKALWGIDKPKAIELIVQNKWLVEEKDA